MSNIEEVIQVPVNGDFIEGNLTIPIGTKSIVLFAHGSGSSRFSPRNQYVAKTLNKAKIATLLIDLLTQKEEKIDIRTSQFRFNIELLTKRLLYAAKWLLKNPQTKNLRLGIFGASTGAAAALIVATKLPNDVAAVVSRGGRPDLATNYLKEVKTPTLFIVGGNDTVVIDLNKEAMMKLLEKNKLEIVLGASHLFAEPGKLEEVAQLSSNWFTKHLK
jgi:putative phosphoribosyl transferase